MLTVISLGGSLIVPDKIDVNFLKKFRKIITDYVDDGNRVILMCGGGKPARYYDEQAKKIFPKVTQHDLDWIGILATRLNAELVRSLFKDTYKEVLYDPYKKVRFKKILVVGGYKPGASSDFDAVILAKTYKTDSIINLTNVDYVYSKDPKKHKDAKAIPNLTWHEYRKMIGGSFVPGSHTPFDPVASRYAMKHKQKVIILNGKKINNFKNFLNNKKYRGTVIKWQS